MQDFELLEKTILEDVRQVLGEVPPHLNLLEVRGPRAKELLSILASWVPRSENVSIKGHLYFSILGSPLSKMFLADILKWWRTESDAGLKNVLSGGLLKLTSNATAKQILSAMSQEGIFQGEPELLARLAAQRATADQAKALLLGRLQNHPTRGEIVTFASVSDPEVQRWYVENEPNISQILQRDTRLVLGKLRGRNVANPIAKPDFLRRTSRSPDSVLDRFEVDSADLGQALKQLGQKFGSDFEKFASVTQFLERYEKGSGWFVASAHPFELWFRAEDATTVEIGLSLARRAE